MSIGIVGKDHVFEILDEDKIARYLGEIEGDEKRGRPAAGQDAAQDDTPPQDPPADDQPEPRVSVAMDTE